MAVFYNNEKQKIKTTHFGASGYSDFTQHKDEERKKRYLERHKKMKIGMIILLQVLYQDIFYGIKKV